MRTLELNKKDLWIVEPVSKTEVVDSEGFKTGEYVTTYSTPVKIRLSLYPASGKIVRDIFGIDYSCDQLAVSNDIVFTVNTLIFESEPSSNYSTTYDYRVDKIQKSINVYQYGLRRRT